MESTHAFFDEVVAQVKSVTHSVSQVDRKICISMIRGSSSQ